MTMDGILLFLDDLISFYEAENHLLSTKNALDVLKNTQQKEALKEKFHTIILKLTSSPFHALSLWPPHKRQMAWTKLQYFQHLSSMNEDKLRALTQRHQSMLTIICQMIQKSEKALTYTPKSVRQKETQP